MTQSHSRTVSLESEVFLLSNSHKTTSALRVRRVAQHAKRATSVVEFIICQRIIYYGRQNR